MATILVVDQESIFREPIAAALRLAGYMTRTAANGREALEHVAQGGIDLILLDLALDGLRFLAALRRGSQPARDLPVLLLTAVPDRDHLVHAARLGVRECLLKSRFSTEELLRRIHRLGILADPAPVGAASCAAPDRRVEPPPAAAAAAPTAAAALASTSPPAPTSEPAAISVPRLLTRDECAHRATQALQARTLSGVVAQVISVAASPRSDLASLAELIAKDTVLSARVLQVANSAAYATARGVLTSIPEAVRQIGCATIRNVAAALGIFEMMPESAPDGFNPIRCWQHSFAVARLCSHLRGMVEPAEAGTAYLAGLCHDLGEILFHTHFAAEYRQVLQVVQRSGRPAHQVERDMLGLTRGELVSLILRAAGLPAAIQRPIETFHAASEPGRGQAPLSGLARALEVAEMLANGMLLASSPAASVRPLSRAECRAVSGLDHPGCPDCQMLRAEVFGLTGLLARLSPRDQESLMRPLYDSRPTTLWLARDPAISECDPIMNALNGLSERVQVSSALPRERSELAGCRGLVVCAATPHSAGMAAADIARASALGTMAHGEAFPVLWLVARGPGASGAAAARDGSPVPRIGALALGEVARFVEDATESTDQAAIAA